MHKDDNNLPVFGIGPVYVLSCFVVTALGLALDYSGKLGFGKVSACKTVAFIIGILLIIVGASLWVCTVLIQRIGNSIKEGKLITTGVYSFVRNPIYSAFIIVFTGALITTANLVLLILPIIFWVVLTVVLKCTEERWLLEKFGDEYACYCKRVNRIIPWFNFTGHNK